VQIESTCQALLDWEGWVQDLDPAVPSVDVIDFIFVHRLFFATLVVFHDEAGKTRRAQHFAEHTQKIVHDQYGL